MPIRLAETHIIGAHTREKIVKAVTCPELGDHGISFTGLTDAAPPYAMVRCISTIHHFLICTGGQGKILVDGRWEICKPGDAYLSKMGTHHAFHAMPKKRWQLVWAMYNKTRPWHRLLPASSVKVPGDGRALGAAVEGLYREMSGGAQPGARARWAGLVDFYLRQAAEARSTYVRLTQLWERVDQNPAHDWTIRELAGHAGLSHEHLRRISRLETGRSPMMQVTWLRMNRAITLLQSSPLKIEAIAGAVGYDNQFAFSAAFRRWMGCPPSRYTLRRTPGIN